VINRRRFIRSRSLRAAAACVVVCTLSGTGCSYYTDDLLNGVAAGQGGASATTPEPTTMGGEKVNGGQATSNGGSALTPPTGADTGGMGGNGTTGEQPLPSSGGAPEASAGAPDRAGAGGEAMNDLCPDDPAKLSPGQCGCGVPESCAALKAGLAHRYAFDESGTQALDSVGDADGTIVGASASQGKVAFDGKAAAYVDLPNGCVSALKDASFELWLQWGGGSIWQRIFDFGSNDKGEGNQGSGVTYLYVTPSDGWNGNALRASFSLNGVGNETTVRTSAPLPTDTTQHLVLVIDDTHDEMRMYLNGSVVALTGFTKSLSSLQDINNWVGRSNFVDAPLKATIEELRIYKVALTPEQVTASYGFGPNPGFL